MSINNSKKNVADNPFRPANSQLQSPGLTYGARAQFQRVQQPTSPAPQVDQFDKSKKADTSAFTANASFKAQRRQYAEGYQLRVAHNLEQGAPRKGGSPSDETILNFLDKVISHAPVKKPAVAAAAKKQFIKA
jgi:hypothetical protein